MSILGNKAQSIIFSNQKEFFEAIGFLAKPGRVAFLEAEVPQDGKHLVFQKQFPGQIYSPITQGNTSGGNPMKYGVQYRIYLNSIEGCPITLKNNLGQGRGNCVARINKAKFVEKLVDNFGFKFGYGISQNSKKIRNIVESNYPNYLVDFDRGFNL